MNIDTSKQVKVDAEHPLREEHLGQMVSLRNGQIVGPLELDRCTCSPYRYHVPDLQFEGSGSASWRFDGSHCATNRGLCPCDIVAVVQAPPAEEKGREELADFLQEACKQADAVNAQMPQPVASVHISEEGKSIEIYLDNSSSHYGEWIKGEGADICLLRSRETHRVVGAVLPLYAASVVFGGSNIPTSRYEIATGKTIQIKNAPLKESAERGPEDAISRGVHESYRSESPSSTGQRRLPPVSNDGLDTPVMPQGSVGDSCFSIESAEPSEVGERRKNLAEEICNLIGGWVADITTREYRYENLKELLARHESAEIERLREENERLVTSNQRMREATDIYERNSWDAAQMQNVLRLCRELLQGCLSSRRKANASGEEFFEVNLICSPVESLFEQIAPFFDKQYTKDAVLEKLETELTQLRQQRDELRVIAESIRTSWGAYGGDIGNKQSMDIPITKSFVRRIREALGEPALDAKETAEFPGPSGFQPFRRK